MFSPDQYETLDFGNGRKLERFGDLVLDRPCPAATQPKMATVSLWSKADAFFCVDEKSSKNHNALGNRGFWQAKTDRGIAIFEPVSDDRAANSNAWQIRHGQAIFELRGTPFGHVGLFPEQAENWDAIKFFCQKHANISQNRGETDQKVAADTKQPQQSTEFRVLNLFAYTGGSTLAAVSGGAVVTHVDAAKNVVAWARKNAELSQFSQSQIRWIAEDAAKFVRRELKRGNRYNGIILDPPSYGHGSRGEVWRLSKDLPDLLLDCFSLLNSNLPCFLLLTCHTPGFSLQQLTQMVKLATWDAWGNSFVSEKANIQSQTMTLCSRSGASLPSGESVMFCYND
jgi:Predicted SAM-dependent methyltransferases